MEWYEILSIILGYIFMGGFAVGIYDFIMCDGNGEVNIAIPIGLFWPAILPLILGYNFVKLLYKI